MIKILQEAISFQLSSPQNPMEIPPSSTLHDLGADSLDHIEILMEMEARLDISLDESLFNGNQTVQEWADKIKEKLDEIS